METIQIQLKGDYVRLCDLLKLAGIADSGGRGKQMVTEGQVTVGGQPESRKTAKIRAGQTVECRGAKIGVSAKLGPATDRSAPAGNARLARAVADRSAGGAPQMARRNAAAFLIIGTE